MVRVPSFFSDIMTSPQAKAIDSSLNMSLNPALDPLVLLNPCRRSQLFRVAWATAPIRCSRPSGILQGDGVRLFIYLYTMREKGGVLLLE